MDPNLTPETNYGAGDAQPLNIIPATDGSVVGKGGTHSPNFRTGSAGWSINSDGTAEFNSITAPELTALIAAISNRVGVDTTQTTVTNSTTESNLWSMTVPANTLSTNKAVWGQGGFQFTNSTTGSSQPTFRLYYGSGSISWSPTILNDGNLNWTYFFHVVADGATNAQRLLLSIFRGKDAFSNLNQINMVGGDGGAISVDSTSAQTLKLTVQHATANANLSCVSQSVIVTKFI